MFRSMTRGIVMIARSMAMVLAAASLVACGEEDVPSGLTAPGPFGRVRFVNAVNDPTKADRVNVALASTPLGGGIAYGGAATGTTTTYAPTLVGTWPISVRRSADTSIKVLDYTVNVAAEGTDYTVLGVGNAAGVQGVTLTDANAAPAAGSIKIRVVLASPTAPATVDVYVTAASTDIATVAPSVAGLAYRSASSYLTLAAGAYRIRVTAAGSKTTIRDVTLAALASLAVRTVVVLDMAAPVTSGLVTLTDR
jgi:hypothetical protein